MYHLVKKNVRKLRAYEAKEIPCRVKLDANESPMGFSGALSSVKGLETNRYPDPEAKLLRGVLAKHWRVRSENILHGNGSDELIFSLIATFGGPVLFPVPTFSMYGIIATILNEEPVGISLSREFQLDRGKMLKAVREKKPHLVFLSTPNNPTGNSFDPEIISEIIKTSKGIVVVDEAYQLFSPKKSFVPLLKKYPNLVIMKTLSKIGLAALRSGFIIGRKELIREVNKVRLPFNVNALSQAVALKALQESGKLEKAVAAISSERDTLFSRMQGLAGVIPFPSDANFILFRVKDANAIHKKLLKRGVLIRNMAGAVKNCLRVTIGTPAENRIFIDELTRAVK